MRIDDPKRLESLCSALQSVVVVLGILVGGIWTLWTFTSLKLAEAAKLDIEVKSLRRPVIELAMVASQLEAPKDIRTTRPLSKESGFKLALVIVSVKNLGNESADIDISGKTLWVRKLQSAIGGDSEGFQGGPSGYQVRSATARPTRTLILPGNKSELQYLVELASDAVYQLEFTVQAPATAAGQFSAPKVDINGKVKEEGRASWSTSTFVSTSAWK